MVTIEVNRSVDQAVKDRNARYIMTKHINQFRVSDSYKKIVYSVQINLDWGVGDESTKKVYMLREYNNPNDLYTDKIIIITFNMEKLLKEWYNCDSEEEFEYKYLAMLAIDKKEELIKHCWGDKIMEDYKESMIDINNNDIYKDILSKEKDNMMVIQGGLEYAMEEGYEKGVAENKIEIAKNMLKETSDLSFISRSTGLSLEEIEKLK